MALPAKSNDPPSSAQRLLLKVMPCQDSRLVVRFAVYVSCSAFVRSLGFAGGFQGVGFRVLTL